MLLLKENPGSPLAVGVGLREKMWFSVVTAAVSGSGQNLRGVRRVNAKGPRFAVINVNLKLPDLTDIHDSPANKALHRLLFPAPVLPIMPMTCS